VKQQIFPLIKKFLPLIGLVLFIYTIHQLDISTITISFLSINPVFILLIIPLTLPRILLRNYAWKRILDEQKIFVPYWTSMKIFLIGYFYGTITPGYLGQLMRIPYLKEYTGQPYGKLFINSTIETIVHTFSMYVMILFGAFLVLQKFPELLFIAIAWIVVLSLILFFFLKKERGEWFFRIIIRFFIPKSFKRYLNQFCETFYQEFPRVKTLLFPLFIGFFTWIIIFSQEYILVIALDIQIPYHYFLFLFPLANLVAFIPITLAGFGTRELTAVILFTTLFAVSGENIFVVSILGFILTDLFTGFIGFLISLREARIQHTTIWKLRNQFIK